VPSASRRGHPFGRSIPRLRDGLQGIDSVFLPRFSCLPRTSPAVIRKPLPNGGGFGIYGMQQVERGEISLGNVSYVSKNSLTAGSSPSQILPIPCYHGACAQGYHLKPWGRSSGS